MADGEIPSVTCWVEPSVCLCTIDTKGFLMVIIDHGSIGFTLFAGMDPVA